MPTICDAGHSHSTYSLANMAVPMSTYLGTTAIGRDNMSGLQQNQLAQSPFQANRLMQQLQPAPPQAIPNMPKKAEENSMPNRRLVQVFIADPDENVPLENSMLYTGMQHLTDATDQELFFEIDMKAVLDEHNAKRVTLINKKVKERTEYLEPVKVRDLKMVVVNVATF